MNKYENSILHPRFIDTPVTQKIDGIDEKTKRKTEDGRCGGGDTH